MADGIKFSQFTDGGAIQAGDKAVGLRSGSNYQFDLASDTDALPEGSNNLYATTDGGTTDNLVDLPTITNLQDQIDAIDLQQVYDQGDGTITLAAGKPFELNSTVAGMKLPAMTDAQYNAISVLNNGEMAWSTDQDRILINAGTSVSKTIESVAYLSDIASITDDAVYGEMICLANTTPTTITTANTPVKVDTNFATGAVSGFTYVSGRLTYVGTTTRAVKVTATLTATFNGSSNNATFYIALDGSPIAKSAQTNFFGGVTPAAQSDPVQVIIPALAPNQYLELWVENDDNSDDIIVQDVNFSVTSIGGISYGGVTVVGEDYLSLTGQQITANPVNVSNTNITGILKEASFPALNGDVTTVAGDLTSTIANQAVTYAKIQNVSATSRLLGRYDTGSGSVQEIKLGTNLSLSGDTLNASGSSSSSSYGEMYIAPNNTLATTITANAWTKVSAGSGPAPDFSFYNAGILNNFTFANGRLTYTGGSTINVLVTMTGAGFLSSGSAEIIDYIFFKNGNTAITGSSLNAAVFSVGTSTTAAQSLSTQGTFSLSTNDYIELFCKNTTVANPIFKYANIFIKEI